MRELVFFVEELSAKEMIDGLMTKLLPEGTTHRCVVFEGKQDLEKQLVMKMRGYQNPRARFIVLRDQDSHPDCNAVKARLMDLCREAGRPDALVRIACRELESFYLADLAAVEQGLGVKNLAKNQKKRKFRSPDSVESPSQVLENLTKGAYQKVGGSRAVGRLLDLENTRSASFRNLVAGIRRTLEISEG